MDSIYSLLTIVTSRYLDHSKIRSFHFLDQLLPVLNVFFFYITPEKRGYPQIIIFYFSTKTYVVGSHKKRDASHEYHNTYF